VVFEFGLPTMGCSGKLDALAAEAMADFESGNYREI
jgi:hypothetical protein